MESVFYYFPIVITCSILRFINITTSFVVQPIRKYKHDNHGG